MPQKRKTAEADGTTLLRSEMEVDAACWGKAELRFRLGFLSVLTRFARISPEFRHAKPYGKTEIIIFQAKSYHGFAKLRAPRANRDDKFGGSHPCHNLEAAAETEDRILKTLRWLKRENGRNGWDNIYIYIYIYIYICIYTHTYIYI